MSAGDIILFIVEFLVLLTCIALGARVGGLAIGYYAGLGVALYCFAFRMHSGAIPYDVIQIIMGAVSAIGAMQCAGGLDFVVSLCERLLRTKPSWITYLGPIVTFGMTIFAGTGHTAYSTLPVIIEVAKESGIPPSRPLTIAVVSSQVAICASPISAAVVWLADSLEAHENYTIGYPHILAVMIPSCFVATMVSAVLCNYLGKPLYEDPIFLERVADGRCQIRNLPEDVQQKVDQIRLQKFQEIPIPDLEGQTPEKFDDQAAPVGSFDPDAMLSVTQMSAEVHLDADEKKSMSSLPRPSVAETKPRPKGARLSCLIFLVAVLAIMGYALCNSPSIIPGWRDEDKTIRTADAIVAIFLTCAGIITQFCHLKIGDVAMSSTFRAGMNGCVCVLGVAWMGDTFVSHHLDNIQDVAGDMFGAAPWVFPIVAFVVGCLLYSQASTVAALWPLAYDLNIGALTVVAAFPGIAALFVLPTYPTVLAAIEMDDTGTTRFGKYIFDHSFQIPGFVCIVLSILLSYALGAAIL